MPSCSVRWCAKRTKTSSYNKDGITFHRFPRDQAMKNIWINVTGRENWSPPQNSVVCSRHFPVNSFEMLKNRRRLRKTAVPTLYLPVLSHASIFILPNTSQRDPVAISRNPSITPQGKVTLSSTVADKGQEIRYEIPESKELILRVYRYLREEYEQLKELTENKCDLSALENTLERTATATGVSEKTIAAILKEKELGLDDDEETAEVPAKRRKLDDESGDVRQEEHEEQHDSEGDHDCETEVKQEQDDYVVQTLKIEYEDDEYYSYKIIEETTPDPQRPRDKAQSTVDNSVCTSSTVKSEPDPLSAPCPSLAHVTSGTLTTVKIESDDDELLVMDAAPSLDKFNIQLYKG